MIAIVLAGGSGTRFWPLSRRHHPKQLITLWGDKTMIGHALARLELAGIPPEKIFVVCGPHLKDAIATALPHLPPENLVIEPSPKNTAPAIALAMVHAQAQHPEDQVYGVFPSDHFIGGEDRFVHDVRTAGRHAEAGAIVTLGIAPDRPETGYGYIRHDTRQEDGAFGVEAFVEKPDQARALEYLSQGNYVWNSGMFFFLGKTMRAEFKRQMPKLYQAMAQIEAAMDSEEFESILAQAFEEAPAVSIDYGVMEHAAKVKVIPAHFRWSDVGQWGALPQVREVDAQGNVCEADLVLHEVSQSIFYSSATPPRPIVAAHITGLVVVDTDDALLILPKEHAQDVRVLVDLLHAQGRTELIE